MDDDPKLINFDEFRKPRAPKRKSVVPAVETDSDDPGVRAAALVADSTTLDGKSVEDIAELAMRRFANVVMLGGEAFLPKNLNEATNAAKVWATIASLERARATNKGVKLEDDDPVIRAAQRTYDELRGRQKQA